MIAPSLSTLYTRLIDTTFVVLRAAGPRIANDLDDLADTVDVAVKAPADPRLIWTEELDLARALQQIEHARRYHQRDRERLYCQLAGLLLPSVRDHLAALLEHRRHAATSDHEYLRGPE